ncbi:4-hydroxybenzoate octaprenyltransferase [Leeia aquatica]|uniref:4-hydroxybenzoate octaprenyltransferase n=1 Tax=Leeia aquatica TaxID=2725557 RepID=A0A847SG96_9NEIS|nr:4-hydroxybenzoate octaprenyltransferase [Leeia aquatica]NLR76268.1 4-hydroxybenzoate octaprenyltransferase [Leeia aquatica]
MSNTDWRRTLWAYARLTRFDKPIGTLLLLWPTLWALWLAGQGRPQPLVVLIFVIGTILMRAAGCAINDWADRDFDGHVKRTAQRPLVSGELKPRDALLTAAGLALLALLVALPLPALALWLTLPAAFIAASYPFFKRFFAIPQAYLGIAFGFGIPMAYAALQGQIPLEAWWLLLANVLWTVAYDTEYAMVDRDDDIRIGIRTSALTFGRFDVLAVMLCYSLSLLLITLLGLHLQRGWPYYAGVAAAAAMALYHYHLIRHRSREGCFAAFRHNNWFGAALFGGILLDSMLH